jgi:hypothetical protein
MKIIKFFSDMFDGLTELALNNTENPKKLIRGLRIFIVIIAIPLVFAIIYILKLIF